MLLLKVLEMNKRPSGNRECRDKILRVRVIVGSSLQQERKLSAAFMGQEKTCHKVDGKDLLGLM